MTLNLKMTSSHVKTRLLVEGEHLGVRYRIVVLPDGDDTGWAEIVVETVQTDSLGGESWREVDDSESVARFLAAALVELRPQ